MKVTKRQFDKAMKDLPQLKQAEAIIKAWNDGIKANGLDTEQFDVTEIDGDSFKGKRKEAPSVVGRAG